MRWWPAPIVLVLAAPAAAQMSPPVPPDPPANCTAPEHRQFDFWIGEWEVFQTARPDEKVGASLIEGVYNGCAIRENWNPFTLHTGGSLAAYNPQDRLWRQTWVDSDNARVDFSGGLVAGRMVLTGRWPRFREGREALVRMSLAPLAEGAVRQTGEYSLDAGKSWSSYFDVTYKPRRS